MIVSCATCRKQFKVWPCKLRNGRGKYCSRSCRSKANIPILNQNRHPNFKEMAKIYFDEHRERVSLDETLHSSWKGDTVGYHALHDWLRKHYGRPQLCEVCGTTDPSKNYEWANLTYRYIRNRNDFKRMCIPCHRKYDKATARKKRQLA